MNKYYKKVLRKIVLRAIKLGFVVRTADNLDEYFKGDLDGETIYLSWDLTPEQRLFNALHLIGHSIQWNIDEDLRLLGNASHINPGPRVLARLQEYEWEANCYALQLLHDVRIFDLDVWLTLAFQKDIHYLTHYYKTGEKLREVTAISTEYAFTKPLVPKTIPSFMVKPADRGTRNGIVI